MVGAQDRSSSKDANNTDLEDSIMPTSLIFTPYAIEAKYWAKRHRTFVASSASSMLATGITVSSKAHISEIVLIGSSFPWMH